MAEHRKLQGNELKNYKQNLKVNTIQDQVIIGTLLGDATMPLRKEKPVYGLKFEQRTAHAEYIEHLYDIFKDFVGTSPQWRIDKDGQRKSYWFRTYRHDAFIYYWNLFYDFSSGEKRKIVPKCIARLLTPMVLAYWFMDDGQLTSDTYYLNTQGFEKHECDMLATVLNNKFNLKTSIHKDKSGYRIYIYKESAVAFRELIKPYILKCFEYRLQKGH